MTIDKVSWVILTFFKHQIKKRFAYGPSETEKGSLNFRRSLYIAENMKKGDMLTENNLRIIRPGLGLPPKYYDILIGRKVKCDVKKGTPMSWKVI